MLSYAKAIGANTDVVTAQAFVFPKEDNSNELLVILITGVGEEAFATIRKAGLDSQELFFAQPNTGEAFEKTSQFLKSEFSSLEQFSLVIGFFEKETLYIKTINDFSVLLYRQNHTTELTRGLEGEKLISGMLKGGDRVLFLNSAVTDQEQSGWQKALEVNLLGSTLENLESEIESFLQQLPKSDPIATVLVDIQSEQVEESEQEDEEVLAPLSLNREKVPEIGVNNAVSRNLPKLGLPSFLQKFTFRPNSRKRLLLIAMILGVLLFIGLFFKNYTSQIAPSPSPQSTPIIANSSNLSDFPVFLDLNLIKENFNATRLSMSLGRIAVLDNNSKSLVAINIEQKQPQILAGSLQLGEVQYTSINGDYVYVFSKDKGILKVDAGNGKTTIEVPPDSEWQRIVDIYGFANNVYLPDEFKNQIWKYIATDNGFSQRNQYLREGESADFAAARNLQIDGAVWVLKSDNTLLKFIQGGKDFFQLGTIELPLDQIKNFYISDETENIYFLDNEYGRVVVTNKKGEYVSQYTGDKFKTAIDLVVDEKAKKLYLLEGGKIYQIDLR